MFTFAQPIEFKQTGKVSRATRYRSPRCLYLGEVVDESAWPRPGTPASLLARGSGRIRAAGASRQDQGAQVQAPGPTG